MRQASYCIRSEGHQLKQLPRMVRPFGFAQGRQAHHERNSNPLIQGSNP